MSKIILVAILLQSAFANALEYQCTMSISIDGEFIKETMTQRDDNCLFTYTVGDYFFYMNEEMGRNPCAFEGELTIGVSKSSEYTNQDLSSSITMSVPSSIGDYFDLFLSVPAEVPAGTTTAPRINCTLAE